MAWPRRMTQSRRLRPWRAVTTRGWTPLRPWRVVAALTVALGWILVAAPAAQAHATLIATTPPAGAQLAHPPAEVTLHFSEQITLVPAGIRLLDSAGHRAAQDEAHIVPAHHDQVSLPVPTALPDGTYVVAWRVVSLDSHPIGGSFVFTIGTATGPAATPSAPAAGQDGAVSVLYWLFRGLGYAALALLVGGVAAPMICWPAGLTDPRARRLVRAGWLAGLLSAGASVLLQGVYVAGRPLTSLADPTLLRTTVDTNFGRLLLARIALLALAAPLLHRIQRPAVEAGAGRTGALTVGPTRRGTAKSGAAAGALAAGTGAAEAGRGPVRFHGTLIGPVGLPLPLGLGLVAVALTATWAGSGHSRAGTGLPLAIAADTAHLLAMSVWLGGLAVLFICVLPVRRGLRLHDVATMLPRFSRLAFAAVAVLMVTGAYQAWRELRGTDLSTGSGYTRILVFKLASFGLLLCLGAASRALVQYRYVRPITTPATAARRTVPSARRHQGAERRRELATLALLRRSVRLELAIAAAILGLTAALVSTSPGHEHPGSTQDGGYQGPFSAQLPLPDGGDVQLWMDPARPGRNELVVNVRDKSGTNRDVPEVRAQFSNATFAADPMPVPLTRTRPGQFVATAVTLPATGSWRLELRVRTSEVDSELVTAAVTLS
jgi:copper transport protein